MGLSGCNIIRRNIIQGDCRGGGRSRTEETHRLIRADPLSRTQYPATARTYARFGRCPMHPQCKAVNSSGSTRSMPWSWVPGNGSEVQQLNPATAPSMEAMMPPIRTTHRQNRLGSTCLRHPGDGLFHLGVDSKPRSPLRAGYPEEPHLVLSSPTNWARVLGRGTTVSSDSTEE